MINGTGSPPLSPDEDTVWRNMLTRNAGALDSIIHAWYPPPPIDTTGIDFPGATYDPSQLMASLAAHRAIHLAGDHLNIGRTVYVSEWIAYTPGDPPRPDNAFTGANAATYGAQIAGWMAEAGWARDPRSGRPILGLVMDPNIVAKTYFAHWGTFRAQLPAQIYLICLGKTGVTSGVLTDYGCDTSVAYGPNGTSLAPVGQHSWTDQAIANAGQWTASGGREVGQSVTIGGDQRGRRLDMRGLSTAWADHPTLFQLLEHIASASGGDPVVIYALTEGEEEGSSAMWGDQYRPTLYPTAVRLARMRPAERPSSVEDMLSANSLNFTRSGAGHIWSRTETVNSPIVGAYESDVRWLVADTDTLTATFTATTRIRHYGPRGAVSWSGGGPVNVGNCTYTVDGGTPVVVDGSTGSGQRQLLFDSGTLSLGSHTLVIAGHASNAGASRRCGANQVTLDRDPRTIPTWLH